MAPRLYPPYIFLITGTYAFSFPVLQFKHIVYNSPPCAIRLGAADQWRPPWKQDWCYNTVYQDLGLAVTDMTAR